MIRIVSAYAKNLHKESWFINSNNRDSYTQGCLSHLFMVFARDRDFTGNCGSVGALM
jgi:hypothetical protein